MRRREVLRGLVLATALAAAPGARADPVEQITSQLRAQGFEIREVGRTWLGRIRIIAETDRLRREIVFDRTTGEIRRDYVTERRRPRTPDAGSDGGSDGGSNGGSNGGSRGTRRDTGRGGGRDEDDDDDDDNDDDDDDRGGRGGRDDDDDNDDDDGDDD